VTRAPDNLPVVLAEARRRWRVEVAAPYEPGGRTAWVAPARTRAGDDVVVKIGWPHPEAEHEAAGLTFWAGQGAVRLLDTFLIDETPALLLERCVPGRLLAGEVAAEDQDVVVADLLHQLWRPPPPDHGFRPLQQMCRMWADGAMARLATCASRDDRAVRDGVALFAALADESDAEVVLFTDLHAGNVLSSRRAPWLAIDPKPYVGDPTYDALQHLLNTPRLHTEPRALVARMAGLLGLDPGRLRRWLFARCAIEAVDDPMLVAVVHWLR
jgi:streptomycin 6-kinase